ncbi:MAG: lysophospholipid acyltransferase family protein [Verrucomicrobiaceae bacterium]|nr:lysophospholipid acyltransferase family protein [Verrucomicrobiaceae bacterium]
MKAKFLGWLIAKIIQVVGLTLRWRVNDHSGVMATPFEGPLIIVFWHNQMFGAALFYGKFLKSRRATVLTSSSRDGDLLAAVAAQFKSQSIRGSSNKRPVAALREMVTFLRGDSGRDLGITPDGPRGPAYKLQPGLIKLSQWAQVPVLPLRLSYSNALTLKTWDGFRIPLPFSRVEVTLAKLERFTEGTDKQSVERQRDALEQVLASGT